MPGRGGGESQGMWACCRGILDGEVCTGNGWMLAARDRSYCDFSFGFLLLPENPQAGLKRRFCVRRHRHHLAGDGPVRRGWL